MAGGYLIAPPPVYALQRGCPLFASKARTMPSPPLARTIPAAAIGAVGMIGRAGLNSQRWLTCCGVTWLVKVLRRLSLRYVGQSSAVTPSGATLSALAAV